MKCPRCRTLVLAEDVNLEHLMAKCRQCNEVFRFAADEIEAITERLHEHKQKPADQIDESIKLPAPRPDSIFVEDMGDERRLVKRWFNVGLFGMALFCVFWDGFLIVWYWFGLMGGGPLIMLIFPLLHVAAGVAITYSTLAGFLNSTVISLSEESLEVSHGPLPWLGNVSVPLAAIDQLYCTGALPTRWQYHRGMMVVLPVSLNALLLSGRRTVLLSAVPREEGLFIEQQLEEWLNIKPERVPGQVD